MKKHLFLFSLTLAIFAVAQNTRFVYDYHFAPNTAKPDSLKQETMFLDITPKGSKFHSQQKALQDSLLKAQFNNLNTMRASATFDSGKEALVKYTVDKSYPDFVVNLVTPINRDRYIVKNERPIVWKIEAEKKTIEKFEVQKATTELGGRQWTAWFAAEIPFPDGPYKFHGLPGLILEMEDSTKTHIYKFAGSKNFTETLINDKSSEGSTILSRLFPKEISISEAKYQQLWKDYKRDPAKDMRQMMSQSNVKVKVQMDGREISDNNEMLRIVEKNAKDNLKNNNNYIEPYLFP